MVSELEKDVAGPLKTVAEVKVALAPNLVRHIDGSIDVAAIKDAAAHFTALPRQFSRATCVSFPTPRP